MAVHHSDIFGSNLVANNQDKGKHKQARQAAKTWYYGGNKINARHSYGGPSRVSSTAFDGGCRSPIKAYRLTINEGTISEIYILYRWIQDKDKYWIRYMREKNWRWGNSHRASLQAAL